MVDFSPIVATTVLDFIDYAAFVVIFLIVYYGFKFVFFKTKEEEDAEVARLDSAREWVGKKVEDYKTKREADDKKLEEEAKVRARKRLLEPAKGWVIKAEQHTEDALTHVTPFNHIKLRNHANQIKTNLHSAKRIIRSAKVTAKGTRRDYLEKLGAYVEVMEQIVLSDIIPNIPVGVMVPTVKQVNDLRDNLKDLKPRCGQVIVSIDQFVDEDKESIAGGAAPRGAPRPYGSP